MAAAVDVSVMIPTWGRPEALRKLLDRVAACDPPPREILVHIDAGDTKTAAVLADATLSVPLRVFNAASPLGPGGGRNRLMREASCECLFSLDDDSYPASSDCFRMALDVLERFPGYAVFALPTLAPGERCPDDAADGVEKASFEGCGAILRRSIALSVPGYVPLRHAFGMEETDLALQLIDAGHRLVRVAGPCIYHEANYAGHARPEVNAAKITNTALLPWLRYPWPYLCLLPWRVLRRVGYCLAMRRFRGIGRGVAGIPRALWHSRRLRRPVRHSTMLYYLKVRG